MNKRTPKDRVFEVVAPAEVRLIDELLPKDFVKAVTEALNEFGRADVCFDTNSSLGGSHKAGAYRALVVCQPAVEWPEDSR